MTRPLTLREALFRGMHGFSMTAQHHMITHRYANLGGYLDQLSQEVGPQQALDFVMQQLDQAAETPQQQASTTEATQDAPV